MSINVTVTGNPVNIKKGKMVCADPDYSIKEFQKRRRMRLEQVRQQSKDIAEGVRNKVRKEKKKQLSDIERQGSCKLKEWQNRKLLELQQQYCECLKDIGLGHSQAAVVETREDIENAYKDLLRAKSKERGHRAALLHEEQNENITDKAKPSQHKKFSRYIENVRSARVSKIKRNVFPFKKTKKHKKPVTNINISHVDDHSDSCTDSDVILESSNSSPSQLTLPTGETTNPSELKRNSKNSASKKEGRRAHRKSRSRSGSPKSPHKQTELSTKETKNVPMDTRISDRIKRRLKIPLGESICPSYFNQNAMHTKESGPVIQRGNARPQTPLCSSSKADFYCQPCNIDKENSEVMHNKINRPFDIPVKPKIALKNGPKTRGSNLLNKVQYYDHGNRYSKEFVCDNSCVHKIQDEIIQICPSANSDQEFFDKVYKIDRDAEERGKKAMNKEKIHKDYEELMQQLPVLQKQERIASINMNKPLFHMSDERLHLYELKKQNQMEQAYEEHFPNTPLITVPQKDHNMQTEPFQTINISESDQVLNLATWDVDSVDRVVTATKDHGVISSTAKKFRDNTDYLKNLLEKLKAQKELLLREVDSLPKNSNLLSIIEEMDYFQVDRKKSGEYLYKNKKTKSDARLSTATKESSPHKASHTIIPLKSSKEVKKLTKKVYGHQRIKHKMLSSSNSSSPSPKKKSRYRKHTLVLQNMSTQTTPNKPVESTITTNEATQNQRHNLSPKSVRPLSPESRRILEGYFEVQIGDERRKKTATSKSSQIELNTKTKLIQTMSSLNDGEPTTQSKVRSKSDDPMTKIKAKPSRGDVKTTSSKSRRSRSPIKSGSNSYVPENIRPCDCPLQDDICEILIKIKDDEPEILIKSPSKTQKPLVVKADIHRNVKEKRIKMKELGTTEFESKKSDLENTEAKKRLQFKPAKPRTVDEFVMPGEAKTNSWREYFSKNGTLGTSTSTSYYSPPVCFRTRENEHVSEVSDSTDRKKINPRLLIYIKKLLSMSRASVDDLGVSTVSDVSTPGSSLICTEKNDPLCQLKYVMRLFNLNPDELAKCLNYSDDTEENLPKQYCTSSSSRSSLIPTQQHESGYDASDSQINTLKNSKVYDDSQHGQKVRESQECDDSILINERIETYTEQNYPKMLSQYTEMCHNKISHLTEMIEKVRLEKQLMLSPELSDKEISTMYLNLPSRLPAESTDTMTKPNSPNSGASTYSDLEQAELDRKLLEIDFTVQKINTVETVKRKDLHTIADIDRDLVERYRLLLDFDQIPSKDSSKENLDDQFGKRHVVTAEMHEIPKSFENESIGTVSESQYTPLLLNIPRLPKLTSSLCKRDSGESRSRSGLELRVNDAIEQSEDILKIGKKPPPSKGLDTVKRFNGNITNVPHELSTIVEVDSQVSAQARRSTSPISPKKIFEQINPVIILPHPRNKVGSYPREKIERHPQNNFTQQKNERDQIKSDDSLPYILTELIPENHIITTDKNSAGTDNTIPQKKYKVSTRRQLNMYQMSKILAEQSTDSSTDKSELETVETMLKSMGLGWAVATIRKTQQALMMNSSSSSSLETGTKQRDLRISDKSDTTEVSLRQFLEGKVLGGSFGNTSSKTDTSLSPFIRELQDISAIQGSIVSSETKNQRTSTPVQTTRSSEKSKNDSQKTVFPVGSDLSSVKSNTDELFITIPSDTMTSSNSQP